MPVMSNNDSLANTKTDAVLAQRLVYDELDASPPEASSRPLAGTASAAINPLHHVKAQVTVTVGSASLTVGELLAAKDSQVITLDREVDGVVDLMLEGQVVARGQLVAVGDYFGIRITELPRALDV